jgi:hypothetical protein
VLFDNDSSAGHLSLGVAGIFLQEGLGAAATEDTHIPTAVVVRNGQSKRPCWWQSLMLYIGAWLVMTPAV